MNLKTLRPVPSSAVNKGRNRQLKLEGPEKWYFHLVIESLPMALRLALLWTVAVLRTIDRTIAGVIVAVRLFRVTATPSSISLQLFPITVTTRLLLRLFIKRVSRNAPHAFALACGGPPTYLSLIPRGPVRNPTSIYVRGPGCTIRVRSRCKRAMGCDRYTARASLS